MCFLFVQGDKVLLRHVVPCKMNLKVKGSYVFVRYMGPLQVTACITSLDSAGETCTVSATNLLHMHPEEPALFEARELEEEDWGTISPTSAVVETPAECQEQGPWRC